MGMLEGKNAIIYGGGGTIGGAAARAFAREGAHVFLAGRTQAPLDVVAEAIAADGGSAETAIVDALDEHSVNEHADAVAEQAGSIDVSFNVIAHPYTHETPVVDLTLEQFMAPVHTAVQTTFLTARAAGRHMVRQRSGVILAFGGTGDPMTDYHLGATQVAFDAIESMRRLFAADLGRHGVRFISLITGGILSSLPEDMPGRDAILATIVDPTMLKRAATLDDVGNAAVFAASDWAGALTAATINISCGAIVDF